MKETPIQKLSPYDDDAINVIIETPQGSRNKYKYEPELGLFTISKVLPAGATFPYCFGFVPGTLGEDGDPIDVLALLDVPVFTGCCVPSRVIGVMEAKEKEDGKIRRNDRIIAVAVKSADHADVKKIDDLNANLLKEIEYFFESYNRIVGKKFKCLGYRGPKPALKLIKQAVKKRKKS